jgi:hypothetical protein
MGFSLTSPAPEKCDPTAKNRVWRFFGEAPETSRQNRPQSLQPRRENHPTTTKVASGRAYWPSRDPIEERGGINLYGMVGNDAVGRWDYMGLAIILPVGDELPSVGGSTHTTNSPPPGHSRGEYPEDYPEDLLPPAFDGEIRGGQVRGRGPMPIWWGEEAPYPIGENLEDGSEKCCKCRPFFEQGGPNQYSWGGGLGAHLSRPRSPTTGLYERAGGHYADGADPNKPPVCTEGEQVILRYKGYCKSVTENDDCSAKGCYIYYIWTCKPMAGAPGGFAWQASDPVNTKCK